MKKLTAIIIIMSVIFAVGCLHYPERDDMEPGEPAECLDYYRCLYYSAKVDGTIDCSRIYDACKKARIWDKCKNSEQRPEGLSFQNCWDKMD